MNAKKEIQQKTPEFEETSQHAGFKLKPENWGDADELIPTKKIVKQTLTNEQYLALEGIVPESDESVKEVDGEYVTIITEYQLLDSLGRLVPCHAVSGTTWTGIPVPADCAAQCFNPWKHHLPRQIFIGVDGFLSDNGNALCYECWQRNEQMIKLKKWLFLVYSPETY